MCASTGIRHGGYGIGVDGTPFDPLDEREVEAEIAAWWEASNGQMKITGRNARNLNPIIRAAAGARELTFAWWWIWPNAGGPARFSAFNARDDKLTGRAWSTPFQHRALIPATWYVEKGVRFEHPSGNTFGIAAITSTVEQPDGSELVTYAMVTREAVGVAANTWNRMPLVLPPDRHDDWLDGQVPGTPELARAASDWSDDISHALVSVSTPDMLF